MSEAPGAAGGRASGGWRADLVRLFSHRSFRYFAVGNALSLVGSWVHRITVGWLAWSLTESGSWLGLVVAAEMLPILFLGVVAGALVDRMNVLLLLGISQVVGFAQAIALAIMHATGVLGIGWLLAMSLLLGCNSAFYQAARLAIVPALVSKEDVGTAVAFSSISFNLARFVGPATAGFLIATVGISWSFASNAASYLIFLMALFAIRASFAEPPTRKERKGFGSDIVEGLTYALRTPPFPVILMMTLAMGVCARPVVELLPGFADSVFGRGSDGLAALTAAVGVGAIAGSALMIGRANRPHLGGLFAASAICSAGALLLFAASSNYGVALAAMALAGFFMVLNGISGQALVYRHAEAEKRGRIMSLWGILQRGGPALGTLVIGIGSDRVGLPLAAGLAALVLLALGVVAAMGGRGSDQRY